ncbi:MAG: hypothetical protein ACKV0T_30765 [Planctomycetales bacterium]
MIELRRHVLKLRFWPSKTPQTDETGRIIDLNWCRVKALQGLHIGELRIDDVIAGQDNLRVIFFVGDSDVCEPLPMIWVLNVFQKKRQDFSSNQLKIFKAQREIVLERFYRNRV